MYVNPNELKENVLWCQDHNELNSFLVDAITKITHGCYSRYKYKYPLIDPHDVAQEAYVKVQKKIHNIKADVPGQAMFSYLTTLIINEMKCQQRYEDRRKTLSLDQTQNHIETRNR